MMSLKTLLRAGLCAALLTPAALSGANAQTLESNTGDIITVGFGFCPDTWIEADGSLLSTDLFAALFSLYGDLYGGDGRITFAVPDFRGRAIVHRGRGPGLSYMLLGSRDGALSRMLDSSSLVPHTHAAIGSTGPNDVASPANASFADFSAAPLTGYNAPADTAMENDVISDTGSNAPFATIAPSVVMVACVQPNGLYPTRP